MDDFGSITAETTLVVDKVVKEVEKQLKEIIDHPSNEIYIRILHSIDVDEELHKSDPLSLLPITMDLEKSKDVNTINGVGDYEDSYISLNDMVLYNELDIEYNNVVNINKPKKVNHRNRIKKFVRDPEKTDLVNISSKQSSRMHGAKSNYVRTLKEVVNGVDNNAENNITCLNMQQRKIDNNCTLRDANKSTKDDSSSREDFNRLVHHSDAVYSISTLDNSVDKQKENDQSKLINKSVKINKKLTSNSGHFNNFKSKTDSLILTELGLHENHPDWPLDIALSIKEKMNANLCDGIVISEAKVPSVIFDKSSQISEGCSDLTLFQRATFVDEIVGGTLDVGVEPLCKLKPIINFGIVKSVDNDKFLLSFNKGNGESKPEHSLEIINLGDDDNTTSEKEDLENFVSIPAVANELPAGDISGYNLASQKSNSEMTYVIDDDSNDSNKTGKPNSTSEVEIINLDDEDSSTFNETESSYGNCQFKESIDQGTHNGIIEENILTCANPYGKRTASLISNKVEIINLDEDSSTNSDKNTGRPCRNQQLREETDKSNGIKDDNNLICWNPYSRGTANPFTEPEVQIRNLDEDSTSPDMDTGQSYENQQLREDTDKSNGIKEENNLICWNPYSRGNANPVIETEVQIINLDEVSTNPDMDTGQSYENQQCREDADKSNGVDEENILICFNPYSKGTANPIPETAVEIINLDQDSDVSSDAELSYGNQQNYISGIKEEKILICFNPYSKRTVNPIPETEVEIINLDQDGDNVSTNAELSYGNQQNCISGINEENILIRLKPENGVEMINLDEDGGNVSTEAELSYGNRQLCFNGIKEENILIHSDCEPKPENGVEMANLEASHTNPFADTEQSYGNEQTTTNSVLYNGIKAESTLVALNLDNTLICQRDLQSNVKIIDLVDGNLATDAKASFEKEQDMENAPTTLALVKEIEECSLKQLESFSNDAKLKNNALVSDGSNHIIVDSSQKREERINYNSKNVVIDAIEPVDYSNSTQATQHSKTEASYLRVVTSTEEQNLIRAPTENCEKLSKRPRDFIEDQDRSNDTKKPKISNNFTVTITPEETNSKHESKLIKSNRTVTKITAIDTFVEVQPICSNKPTSIRVNENGNCGKFSNIQEVKPKNELKRKREVEVAECSKKFKYESDRSEIADNRDPKWALLKFPDALGRYQAVSNQWSSSSSLKLNQDLSSMFHTKFVNKGSQKSFGSRSDNTWNWAVIYDEYLKIIKSRLNIFKKDINENSNNLSVKSINCIKNKSDCLKNTANAIQRAKEEMEKFYAPLTTTLKISSHRKNEAIEINRIIESYETFYKG